MATSLHKTLAPGFKKFTSERIHLVRSAMTLHVIVKTNSYCKSFGNVTELRFQGSFPSIHKWVNYVAVMFHSLLQTHLHYR